MVFDFALLPPEIGLPLFLGLIGASFVASFVTVAFGIGGRALLLAVLAVLMPPAALIPVHGVVQLGSNASRLMLLRRFVSWPAMPGFVVGSLVGCALGGLIAVDLPPRYVQAGVGAFIIWSVFAKPPQWLRRWPLVTGGVSSFLTMFFGATGLFVANYTKSLELERHAHVATHAALMTVQHLLKVIIFGLLGFAFGPWLAVIVGMIVSGFVGTWIGRALLSRMSDLNFRRALDVILILISLRLIWAGVFGG